MDIVGFGGGEGDEHLGVELTPLSSFSPLADTAYALDKDGKWYNYDDSYVSPARESDVVVRGSGRGGL